MALRSVSRAPGEILLPRRQSHRFKIEPRREIKQLNLCFKRILAVLPDLRISPAHARPARHFSTHSSSHHVSIPQRGKEIQHNIEKACKISLPEQQQLLLRGIANCFEDVLPLPFFKQGFTPADVQYLLKKTESSSDTKSNMPNMIFPAQKWADQDWENAIRALLFRLGARRAPWANPQARDHFLTRLALNKIVWPKSPFKIYPSDIYKIQGHAATTMIPFLKEEVKKNPQLQLILVHEGVWSGRVLVDCYKHISQEIGISVKIVGSDFCPTSLGMFLVHAEQIAGIPKQDIYAFKNDRNFPLSSALLQQQGLNPQDSHVCYIYFPVFYNVNGNEGIQAVIHKLSDALKKGDRVHVYEPEDSDPEERKILTQNKATISAKFLP